MRSESDILTISLDTDFSGLFIQMGDLLSETIVLVNCLDNSDETLEEEHYRFTGYYPASTGKVDGATWLDYLTFTKLAPLVHGFEEFAEVSFHGAVPTSRPTKEMSLVLNKVARRYVPARNEWMLQNACILLVGVGESFNTFSMSDPVVQRLTEIESNSL